MKKNNCVKLALTLFITTAMCASLTGCPGGTPTATKSVTPGSTTTTAAAQGQGTIKGVVYKSGIQTAGLSIFADEAKGGPAAGAKVVVKGSLDLKETVTKDDGSFEITVKAGAEYSVEAAFADETGALVKRTTTVKVPAAKDPQMIDIGSLVTRRTGSIQGVVELDDGKDAEGVDIFIAGTSSVGKAHSKGRFALTGVDAGTWKVVLQKAGYETAYQEIEVKSGRPAMLNSKIVLKKANPKAGIKGKITNNQGQPIPGVLVTAFLQDKDIVAKDRPDALDNYITTTDIDGNYELLNLPTLKENGKGIKYSIQYYRAFYEYVSPVNLELLNTDMPKKIDDITMTSNIAYFGQIKGKVVDEKGEPVDGAVVQTDPQVTDQKYTDANGNFTLDRVVAGEYQLSIAAGGYCEVLMPIALINEKNKAIQLENPVVLLNVGKVNDCTHVADPGIVTPVVTPSIIPSLPPVVVPSEIPVTPPTISDLVAYYSFDKGDATDDSGNGYNGKISGTLIPVDGIKGNGLSFNDKDGDNGCGQAGGGYVTLPKFPAIWENGFTVCAWASFKAPRNFERIIDFGNTDGDSGGVPIWFGREGGANNITIESWIDADGYLNRTKGRLAVPNGIDNDKLKFYCATTDKAGNMKVYINGVKVAEQAGNPIANVERSQNFIGHSNWCGNDPDFKGVLDEIRIYKKALSESDIQSLFTGK